MNSELIKHLEETIGKTISKEIRCIKTRTISGGCINEGFEFLTVPKSYFVKINSANKYPKMFEMEAKGLKALSNTKCIRIPNVILSGEFENTSYLVLEFINAGQQHKNYWTDFGQKLAMLHQNSNDYFGLDHNNYIGSIPQSNEQNDSFTEFFIKQRLEPLLKSAFSNNLLESGLIRSFDKLFYKLDLLIPQEKPALLHGDLWSGNVITDENGNVCLIDPAVYYGHREIDLAFSTLFGAFKNEFYQSYNDFFKLENDWRQRIELFNIYPLLVHLLLFGKAYYTQLKSAVTKYI